MTISPEGREGILLLAVNDEFEELGPNFYGPSKDIKDIGEGNLELTVDDFGEQQGFAFEDGRLSSGLANDFIEKGLYRLGVYLRNISPGVESAICSLRFPKFNFDFRSEMLVDFDDGWKDLVDANNPHMQNVAMTHIWTMWSPTKQNEDFPGLLFVPKDKGFLSTLPFAFSLRHSMPAGFTPPYPAR